MRNVFLLVAILIFGCNQVSAQWSVGGKGGINFSTVNYPGSMDNPSSLIGVNLGFLVDCKVDERLSVGGEFLLYSLRGYKEKDFVIVDVEGGDRKDLTRRLNYVDIPVFVKYYIHSGLNLHAGAQLGIALSQTILYDNKKQKDADLIDHQLFDYGVIFGVGYDFAEGLFLEGRYLLGLNSTIKHGKSFENRSIQLSVGYKFNL